MKTHNHLRVADDHAAMALDQLRKAHDKLSDTNPLGADAVLSVVAELADVAQAIERLANLAGREEQRLSAD